MKFKEFLRRTNVNEFTDLPFMENFVVCAKAQVGTSNMNLYHYLDFLKFFLKKYNKKKGIVSFEEFLNNEWPPKKKITCSDDADD